MSNKHFQNTAGFCSTCGSIFPPLRGSGKIVCYVCKKEYNPEVLGELEIEYRIHFNSYDGNLESRPDTSNEDGPIVERVCSKCNHDKMSYATLQLRSADEGQTVFFTCIKCGFKESENS